MLKLIFCLLYPFTLNKCEKAPHKVTKDSKRLKRKVKSNKKYMARLKRDILCNNQLSISCSMGRSTGSSTSSMDSSVVGSVVVLDAAICVCVFAYKNKSSQASSKEQVKEQQKPIKPTKRRNML